jgi:acyl transferase domain-containing protein
VRFGEGLGELLKESRRVLLEVGPGQTLSGLARPHPTRRTEQVVIASGRHPKEKVSDEEHLLKALGRLWLAGVEVDWAGFYAGERRRRVSLPTYPFERQRYWVDAPMAKRTAVSEPRKKPDIADWFYVPSWTRSVLPISSETDGAARWLVFADESGLGAEVARQLGEMGRSVVSVRAGEGFAASSEGGYTIDPRREEDYRALLAALRERGVVPNRIAHLWGVTASDRDGADAVKESLALGFYSLLFLARAIGQEAPGTPIEIAVVTTGAQDVTGQEALFPAKATALGPCKVIPQEYPAITCRSIDVEGSSGWTTGQVERLTAELDAACADLVVAHRTNRRWVQGFQPLKVKAASGRPARLREGGVYLVTGGLGGIGLELAASLARVTRAKLVLTSRALFPSREEWPEWLSSHDAEDATSGRIRRMQALEELGAEVLVIRADVARESDMRASIEKAQERFGALHGVIHAAGAEDARRPIAELDRAHCERQFRPKLQGLTVLAKVLEGLPLDFCMLHSSLSSVLGAVGFVSYTAAHLFMDAFAAERNRTSHRWPWICVNWDIWHTWKVGERALPAGLADFMMTPEEGAEAFGRVLSLEDANPIVVSTGDLHGRIDQWVKRSFLPHPGEGAAVPHHARPALRTAYAAPRNEVERTLAGIWQDLLGIGEVGIHDNFFELGGDSVLSIQVAARSAQRGLRLGSPQVLEHQTIAELAAVAGMAEPRRVAETAEARTAANFPGARLNPEQLEAFLSTINRSERVDSR